MVVSLSTAEATATLDPQGARLASYRSSVAGLARDWLLPAQGAVGSFVMVPFCSRIRGGQFEFHGRRVQLPANNPPEPHTIHGQGWQSLWQVVRQQPERVLLHYEHAAGAWPWAYRAELDVGLQAADLKIRLKVTNCADSPMPVGIGFHLYFPLTAGAELRAQTSHRWDLDAELLAIARRPLAAKDPPLAAGLAVAADSWDAVFGGWDRHFEIRWPEWQAMLRATATGPMGDLVVYAPAHNAWFCAEPVSNVPDAFNLRAAGVRGNGTAVLAPGAELAGAVVLSPRPS